MQININVKFGLHVITHIFLLLYIFLVNYNTPVHHCQVAMVNIGRNTILVFSICFLVIFHLGSLRQGIVSSLKALFKILATKSGKGNRNDTTEI